MTAFSDLGLSPNTLRAVADTGYTEATPIQAQAIPVALTGRDVLGIAQTGTGKTAAFTLPMIDRLAAGSSKARMPRSLVIAPTRELADQVASSFEKYAVHTKLSWALLIGGVSFEDQLKKLDRGVDVLIATPGRLLDHFERGKLLLTGVQIMVVDEADRMLDMGFIPDLERIFKLTPANKQTLFFSATMPPEITRLTAQFLKDPTRIEASRPATTGENITQYVARTPTSEPKAKRMALRALVEKAAPESGIVFCNRKTDVDIVAKSLKKHGFDAAPIHGDLDQSMRTRTLEAFRKGELKLLVASDVAARGLDIPAVSHVFNYDVPHHADDYVHRIGRTGRAGRSGETFMILSPNDARSYDKVLKLTKKEPQEVVLDLDWSLAEGGDERRPSSRDRDRSKSRSPRERDRERPRKDHGERASMEPVAQDTIAKTERPAREFVPEAEAPIAAETAPRAEGSRPERSRGRGRNRGERGERGERPQAEAAPVVEAAPEPPRQPEPERSPARAPERGERPVRGVRSPAPRDDDDRGPKVVGFGADVPSFLMRAPRPSSED